MQSIGGGVVRFVELAWLECPERPEIIGECTTGGTIEVLWNGKVMESITVQIGDQLLVPDGTTVAPGTWVVSRTWWSRRLRADLPRGVRAAVRWSEAPAPGPADEVTGLSRLRFPRGEGDITLDLVDGDGLRRVTLSVSRDASPVANEGDVVTRGAVLAHVSGVRRDEQSMSGIESLRDFLDGRVSNKQLTAAIAPCDGRIEAIEPRRVMLRGGDGRIHVVRRRARSYLTVREGDEARAGEALDLGQRSHHDLLRVWGEERLARHMVEELELETASRSLAIPRAYWVLVVRAMLAWRRVLSPGGTGLRRHRVLSRRAFEQTQRETEARGGATATSVPVLRGMAAMAREKLGSLGDRGRR